MSVKWYGQFETDRVIDHYMPPKCDGVCIEVGAGDGIRGSNTYFFELMGWECVCIEPNPELYKQLVSNRKHAMNVACGAIDDVLPFHICLLKSGIETSISSLIPDQRLIAQYESDIVKFKQIDIVVRRLGDILLDNNLTKIDFISIDTEGTELDVLRGIDFNIIDVKLLVVENNFDDPFIEDYLRQFGYFKVERYYINDFYMKVHP